MVEHASLGEVPPRRVGAERRDVAHVDDAVGEERHGGVERGQREEHARGVAEAGAGASSRARGGCRPPAHRGAGRHRTDGRTEAGQPRRRRLAGCRRERGRIRKGVA